MSTKPRPPDRSARSRAWPWNRRTARPGANRWISASQLPSSEAGQTTRVGPGAAALLGAVEGERDQGDGLAEPHVVGEAGAEPERGELVEPGEAVPLVVAQRRPQPGRRLERLAGRGRDELLAHPQQAGADDDLGLDALAPPRRPR